MREARTKSRTRRVRTSPRTRRADTSQEKAPNYLQDGYWWLVYPVGICLVLVVMAFNFIGDALRDTVDVRLRRR